MGSVTSAFTRTRNALVKVGSEPENHESERTRSAPESDRAKKKSARINASSQTGRRSSRTSLSEVLNRPDSGGGRQSSKKKTSEGQQSGRSSTLVSVFNHVIAIQAQLDDCCCRLVMCSYSMLVSQMQSAHLLFHEFI